MKYDSIATGELCEIIEDLDEEIERKIVQRGDWVTIVSDLMNVPKGTIGFVYSVETKLSVIDSDAMRTYFSVCVPNEYGSCFSDENARNMLSHRFELFEKSCDYIRRMEKDDSEFLWMPYSRRYISEERRKETAPTETQFLKKNSRYCLGDIVTITNHQVDGIIYQYVYAICKMIGEDKLEEYWYRSKEYNEYAVDVEYSICDKDGKCLSGSQPIERMILVEN